jgi:LysR family transcriptional regulator, nitrogen assimilation regulatory protein
MNMGAITRSLYHRRMDVRALRYFEAVAEAGSYSRGADVLRISQPAVSRQIRALEEELGRPLFVRHSHGVSLTEAGRRLLERSQSILRQLDQARADIRHGQDGLAGEITLAVPPAAGTLLVPALTRRLAALYPNVALRISAGFSTYVHEWLMRGRVDLACLHDPTPQPGFVVTPLVREEVFLVGRPGSLPGVRKQVRIADLAGVSLILPARPNASRRLLDQWLSREGMQLDVRMEVDDHLVIRAMLRDGLGCSLLTKGAFAHDVPAGLLQAWRLRPTPFWNLMLMQTPVAIRQPLAAAVADVIQDTVATLLKARSWPGGLRI